jgi:hypothetical protein
MASSVPEIYEPGNHGSIVTAGGAFALAEPWANAFAFDCTRFPNPRPS